MCGIAGYFGGAADENIAAKMGAVLKHRGPDSSGVWIDRAHEIAFAHQRLSIIDLTPAGHQPMHSASGRFTIVFNGEIYNHLAIRSLINENSQNANQYPKWRGISDTETLIEAIAAWGVEKTLKLCVGMFAFALFDRRDKTLVLARDRFGEKPLYYGFCNKTFMFASELKALKRHPDFECELDRGAIALYLRHGYIPAPFSIYKNIKKLRAAHFLTLKLDENGKAENSKAKNSAIETPYWSLFDAYNQPPLTIDFHDAADELERLLRQSIKGQMVADVPLGAFLSGGVDSSSVAALMQAEQSRPVRTFSIGFFEKEHNEAHHAKAVANHLGADHTELYVRPDQAIAVFEKLRSIYDEPFGDSSQIPTILVSEMTRQFVTVSLSGDAGDELFGGYSRYFLAENIRRKIGFLPPSLRSAAAKIFALLGRAGVDRLGKLAEVLSFDRSERLYQNLLSSWKEPARVVLGAIEPKTIVTDETRWLQNSDFLASMQYIDSMSYLTDDILTKVDRAAMSVSLETRVPFLDHRIAEFAARLPRSMKIDGAGGKRILREVLYRHVPRKLIDRPKMGFGAPIESWLRQDLLPIAEDLLSETRLKREGIFDPEPILRKWREHKSGVRSWHYYLWQILIFESWLEQQ